MESIYAHPCFIIHMAKHPEREDVYRRIVEAGFSQVQWFDAVDGNHLPTLHKCLARLKLPRLDHSITSGALGCLLSHLSLLEKIIQEQIPITTIFEDDVVFHPEWSHLAEKYLALTPSYEVLFIGNQLDSCRMSSTPGPEITQESVYCTHSYVVTLEGAKKLFYHLTTWDSERTPYTGLTMIDYMIKNIQVESNKNSIPKPFVWYSWNGTSYPCEQNPLPIRFEHCRNTGLVFQDTRLPTTIQNSERVHLEPCYNLPNSTRKVRKPMSFLKTGSS